MKPKFHIFTIFLFSSAFAVTCVAPKFATAQGDPNYNNSQPAPDQQQDTYNDDQYGQDGQQVVDFNTFYNELSPYGTWDDDPTYGQVWVCNDPGFTPYYSGGNWAYTDAGWAWVSTYNWGWAPFHYGRWAFTNRWLWVPGYEWAPAWVTWRGGGDYYGWAPLGPGTLVDENFGHGNYLPAERWNFCRRGYLASPNFTNYCLDRRENITVITNTNIINKVNVYRNARFVAGPERQEVERFTGNRINTVAIRNAARPGATVMGTDGLQIYRPNVRPAENGRFNKTNGNHTNSYTPAAGQNNQPRPNSSYNRPQYYTAPQHNNNVKVPGNIQYQNGQQQNRQPYQQEEQPTQVQPAQPQRPVHEKPVTPIYQQPARPQYQTQTQPQRQPVYNNGQQYQPQQRQYQPAGAQYQQPARAQNQPQQATRQPVYNTNRPQPLQQQKNSGAAASPKTR